MNELPRCDALRPSTEVHKSLTQMQASMMFKLVTARAINSAFLLFIITSDEDQLKDQTLTKVPTFNSRAFVSARRCFTD